MHIVNVSHNAKKKCGVSTIITDNNEMKNIALLFLILFSYFNLSGQIYYYVDSLQIITSNPTTIDTLKVKIFGDFASSGSFITNSSINTNSFQVDLVIDCADYGGFTVIVPYDTTFTIGNLPVGNYIINLSGNFLGDFVPADERLFTVSGATDIKENSKNNYISIYPNPFKTQTTLYSDQIINDAILTIFNSRGQTVKQIKNISGQTITLQRDNLASGIYYLQFIQYNKIFATDKLVITDN